jgi:hypothetical protein
MTHTNIENKLTFGFSVLDQSKPWNVMKIISEFRWNKSPFFKTKPTINTCLRIIVSWKLELYCNYFVSAWHYHLWTWTIIIYLKLGQFFVNKWKWTKGPSATLALGLLWSRLRPTLGSWPKVSLGHGKMKHPPKWK